jgi:hypothetical protein
MIKNSGGYMIGIITGLIIILGSAGIAGPDSAESFKNAPDFHIDDGYIVRNYSSSEKLDIPGYVTAFHQQGKSLYFITATEGFYHAGCMMSAGNSIFNTGIEAYEGSNVKLQVCSGVFFFSVSSLTDESATLYRFSPDLNAIQSISNIKDFSIISGNLLVLREGLLNYNGIEIPVMLQKASIGRVIDNRIVHITNGADVEICDIAAAKSIYQYRDGIVYDSGDNFNVIFEFYDPPRNSTNSGKDEKMVYYNVTVNGHDIGRTETGPAAVVKQLKAKVKAGSYNIIAAERWELDKSRGRYVRVNNINQPDEIRIFVPFNRVVKINYNCKGTVYTITQNVFAKNEEDQESSSLRGKFID